MKGKKKQKNTEVKIRNIKKKWTRKIFIKRERKKEHKKKRKREIRFKNFKNGVNKSYSNKLIDSLDIYYNNENQGQNFE